jgi:hypothetical protein
MPVTNTGAESKGISAHGTILKRNGTAIAEVKDITAPALTRKPIETTTHNSDDDSYVPGVRRKSELQFMLNFLPSGEATHNSITGLLEAWATGQKDRYDVLYPSEDGIATGAQWIFSGFVSNIAPKMPVDGALEASVSIRPSGGEVFLP